VDAERLRADLEAYDPDMGPVNRHLAIAHHDVVRHAAALVQLFKRLRPERPPDPEPLRQLARMARIQSETEQRRAQAEAEAHRLRSELERLRGEYEHLLRLHGLRRHRIAQAVGTPLDRLRDRLRRAG
jgi:hypothetical protein